MSDFLIGFAVAMNSIAAGVGIALWKWTTRDKRWESKALHGSLIAFNVAMVLAFSWSFVR